MPRRITTITMTVALSAVALFGLTACTTAPATTSTSEGSSTSQGSASSAPEDATGDDGQSTADACALVQETISGATDEFENAGDDPAAVVDAMKAASEKLAGAAGQVTNDEVAALLPSLQQMFSQASEVMAALVGGDASKVDDLSKLSTSFQETSEEFRKICAP